MLSFLLAVSSVDPNLLTCSEYNWIVAGLEEGDVDTITNRQRAEIKIELIRATDPKCFEN
jgi:hypothetical protein